MMCCPLNRVYGCGHNTWCGNHPDAGKTFLTYPDGVGDVKFTYFDGQTFTVTAVQFDTIAQDPNGPSNTLTCDRMDGEMFHIPNCAMWEVVYE